MMRWPFYRSWRAEADPVSLAAFDAWDRAQRKRLGFFAGLKVRRWAVSRHWPHLLCWSWALEFERRTSFGWRQFVPIIVTPGYVAFGCWWSIALRWQACGYMGGLGQYANHPKIEWRKGDMP